MSVNIYEVFLRLTVPAPEDLAGLEVGADIERNNAHDADTDIEHDAEDQAEVTE